MSSMIKKKGAFAKTFKPKAPQARRPPGAGAPPSTASSTRPSAEPLSQSQTPSAPTTSTPTSSTQPLVRDLTEGSLSHPVEVESTPQPESSVQETTSSQDAATTTSENRLKRKPDVETQLASDENAPPTKKTRSLPTQSDSTERAQDAVPQPVPDQQTQSDSTERAQDSLPKPAPDQQTQTGVAHTPSVQPAEDLPQTLSSIKPPQAPSMISPTPFNQDVTIVQSDSIAITAAPSGSQEPDTTIHNFTPEASTSPSPSRESTQETTQSEAEVDLSSMGPGQSETSSHIVPSAMLNSDGTSGVGQRESESVSKPAKGKKRAVRRRKIQPQEGDVRATIEIQLHRPKRAVGEKRVRKKKEGERKKRRRAPTPEGAEDEQLPVGITMGDLCKDLRIGKKFSKHDEIRQRDKKKSIAAKLAKAHPELVPAEPQEPVANEGEGSSAQEEAPRQPNTTVQMKIVDGNIVVDDHSLSYDAHKAANSSNQVQEIVEENDFTKLLTSGTYMKKVRAIQWTLSDNELFYKCLRCYGTDFQMIATHFPGRDRRQIKLKFNAEDKAFPARISKILTSPPEPIDIEEHQSCAGIRYEAVSDIEAAAKAEEERHEAEQAAELEKQAESTRKKKAEIQARSGVVANENPEEPADGEASAGPKSRKKSTAKKAKNKHSAMGGGEEVEVVGTVER